MEWRTQQITTFLNITYHIPRPHNLNRTRKYVVVPSVRGSVCDKTLFSVTFQEQDALAVDHPWIDNRITLLLHNRIPIAAFIFLLKKYVWNKAAHPPYRELDSSSLTSSPFLWLNWDPPKRRSFRSWTENQRLHRYSRWPGRPKKVWSCRFHQLFFQSRYQCYFSQRLLRISFCTQQR